MEYELKVCGTCAAFGRQFDHGQEIATYDDGACRLNPPQNIPIRPHEYATLFPNVNREDWCCSWIPKEVD